MKMKGGDMNETFRRVLVLILLFMFGGCFIADGLKRGESCNKICGEDTACYTKCINAPDDGGEDTSATDDQFTLEE